MATKSTNLVLICNFCKDKDGVKDYECSRCTLAYCSEQCRTSHWDENHKSNCCLKVLPEVPRPEADSETQDKYIQLAVDAHRDGRYVKEIRLLEAYHEKSPEQPGIIMSLVQLYKSIDGETAFVYAEKLVAIFQYTLSDGRYNFTSSRENDTSAVDEQICDMWKNVFAFMKERYQKRTFACDLQRDADIYEGLYKWANDKGPDYIPNLIQSDVCLGLGNLYFQIGNSLKAVEYCRLSHSVVENEGGNIQALEILITAILVQLKDPLTYRNPEAVQRVYQQAADEARNVKEIMKSQNFPDTFRIEVQIASALLKLYDRTPFPEGKLQEIVNEIMENANSALGTCRAKGDTYGTYRAQGIIDGVKKNGWI